MLLFLVLPKLPDLVETFADSTMLSVMIAPALYFFVYQPLVREISERSLIEVELRRLAQQLQESFTALEEVNKELEQRVAERTATIYEESQALQEEVGHLLDVVSAVENGDLTIEAQVSQSVTGLVGDTLNRLIERLGQIMAIILRAAGRVTQGTKYLEQLAVAVADNVQQQIQTIAQVQTLMEEITDQAEDAALQAVSTGEAVQLTRAAIDQGQQEITAMTQGIQGLQQETNQIVKRTQTLTSYVELAAQFVKDQKRIAAMSQILAVNASMLANRAKAQQDPEQMPVITHEFETIAAQVNQLATQTDQSLILLQQRTDQIQTVVSGLNYDVQEISQKVDNFTIGVEQSQQVFNTIRSVSEQVAQMGQQVTHSSLESNQSDAFLDDPSQTDTLADLEKPLDQRSQADDLTNLENIKAFLDQDNSADQLINFSQVQEWLDQTSQDDLTNLEDIEEFLDQDNPAELLIDFSQVQEWLDQTSQDDFLANPLTQIQEQDSAVDEPPSLQPPPILINTTQASQEKPIKAPETVQIPVPLEKLDQSAKYLIETLLALRATQGFYRSLQNQIAQLVTLAQEGVQSITHLRQIQDDYVLLDQLRNSTQTASKGPTPERYRQGYAIINRLLETNLRLSEIGAETGKTSQQIAQFLRNVDNNVLKLQNTIEDSRLVPFQNLSVRAKAILRELTIRYGKLARLVVQGEQTELDVNTARDLEPALLHLIRNAYDHGLEFPAERVAQGKPDQGTISLSLQRQGNLFQFEIKDDGRGIDAKAVQAKAEALGLPLLSTQTPAELLAVICQPGFSSQSQVSEISGRGIGMDVVAAQVARLGGRLSLHTLLGTGTTFHLKFPVPRLLVSCVLLRSGDSTFAIPVDDIKTINLLSNLNVSPVKDSNHAFSCMIDDETGSLPALDLLKCWQPRSANRPLADTTVCLYIYGEEAQPDVWLLADELLEHSEIIINPLPKPLVAPDGLIGVSLQANGALFPVLEARKLAERLLSSPSQAFDAATIPSFPPDVGEANHLVPSILIVDDAALMRRRLEATLNTYGYLTHTCTDGQEAWNWLQAHPHPHLVITDIEMPNMDGFTLVDRCRTAEITVPILVISSRLSEEWFDEARRLGATDYLTKGFSTIDLIKKVRFLLTQLSHI